MKMSRQLVEEIVELSPATDSGEEIVDIDIKMRL